MEYALEYGFLRLTPKTRERLNITHYCFLYSMARGEVHSGVCLRVRVSTTDTKNKGEIEYYTLLFPLQYGQRRST